HDKKFQVPSSSSLLLRARRERQRRCTAEQRDERAPVVHSITSSAGEQRGWHFEAERLGGLYIDGQLDLRGLLHREVGGLLALENTIDVASCAPIQICDVGSVGDQATAPDEEGERIDDDDFASRPLCFQRAQEAVDLGRKLSSPIAREPQ